MSSDYDVYADTGREQEKLMYNRQLKNRKQRMMALVTGTNHQSPSIPAPSLFGASFLDDFRIEYDPKDFADIDWGAQTDLPSWERRSAS